jgi:hypothetical protein
MLIFLYTAMVGIALYFLIRQAVQAGVTAALTSESVSTLLTYAVRKGIDDDRQLEKKLAEFSEDND